MNVYLLSSTLTQNYELRMDLYDQDFYLGEQECCIYWKPEFIISYLEKDIAYYFKLDRKHGLSDGSA